MIRHGKMVVKSLIELWNMLTDQNHKRVEGEIDDSDKDIEGNDHVFEKGVQDSV